MSLCSSIGILAIAYLDDELAGEDRRELELHLLDCDRCKRHVDGLRRELALIRRALASPVAPGAQRTSIERALDAEDRETARVRRSRLLACVLPSSASLAAVTSVVIFALAQVSASTTSESTAGSGMPQLVVRGQDAGPWRQMSFRAPGGEPSRYSDGTRRVDAIVLGCSRCHRL